MPKRDEAVNPRKTTSPWRLTAGREVKNENVEPVPGAGRPVKVTVCRAGCAQERGSECTEMRRPHPHQHKSDDVDNLMLALQRGEESDSTASEVSTWAKFRPGLGVTMSAVNWQPETAAVLPDPARSSTAHHEKVTRNPLAPGGRSR